MTLGYEIPQGSKIHFGLSAKIKRDIELKAVDIFYQNGFEEILTPSFSFGLEDIIYKYKAIRISADDNKQMILRNDNTTDVIKIIHRHLGNKISNKKWFYIQPSFSYPSTEINQIGAEFLDKDSLGNILCIAVNIFLELELNPILQISNMNIPKLCVKESELDIDIFSKMKIDRILKSASYFGDLLSIQTKNDLESYIPKAPRFLKEELEILLHSASYCDYKNTMFSPLYYSPNGYYDSLFFRMFNDNKIFLLGGKYEIDDVQSCGFAIYTNEVVEYILNKVVE
ncbi:ATP phosphoribosyltransferase regulatory subunit [Helicobacter sp. 16-1353]|uniref:ATP phosphoribosyltransferase regulatory subunit n=1 Tax=Helicobacter sp. 16-1353 TaxID=2004996 RepID=UPI000DCC9229|nr:ATP phosphoribosyltransferase regulatory subunit [Helicobacter sp. 16-1353]RAX54669.1 ATP phosphoribosyltransferase regulatory subunit [Helicobacter sp. 16-1353]